MGHDEYWSLEMYDNVLKARDEGVSLAFLSANAVLCVVPMLPIFKAVRPTAPYAERRLVCLPKSSDFNEERSEKDKSRRDDFEASDGAGWCPIDGGARTTPAGHGSRRLDLRLAGALAL